jgi:hypothetical protein
MYLWKVGRLFFYRALWQATGSRWAGRALVRALGAREEDVRTVAGMFLIQAGKRAIPLLEQALSKRENLPGVLSVLADIGDTKFESEMLELSSDRDPQVARAAQEALRILATHR